MSSPAAPSRRRARPTRSRADTTVVSAVVLVVLAAVAVVLTPSSGPSQGKAAVQTTGQLVSSALLGCPGGAPPTKGSTTVAVGSAPAEVDPALTSGGQVRAGATATSSRPVGLARGRLVALTGASAYVAATGALAPGLFGFRADDARSTLAATACPAPRAQWWFAGAGAGLDHASTLELTNVDTGPAVVNVSVLGPNGPVDTVGTEGIQIAPGTRRRVELSSIAPQTDELALSVHADRGRVVAAMTDAFAPKQGGDQGQEWLAGTDRPSRVLRLSGVAAKADTRTLFVANPGDLEAVVHVQIAGRSGTFAPVGLRDVTVAPGTVQQVDLGSLLSRKEAVGLRITSNLPVVGSLRSVSGSDDSYAVPVLPLTGSAAAPLLTGARSTVEVTAGGRPAQVRVTAYDGRGRRIDGATLDVQGTGTTAWSPGRKAVAALKADGYVLVTPTHGHVHGAVTYEANTSGAGTAAVPLVALPIRLVRPTVRPALY